MSFADWFIVIVLGISILAGMTHGFLRSICSLLGLILGLALASWNYGHVSTMLLPILRFRPVADAAGFLLVAVLVMVIAGVIGKIAAKAVRVIGLGWLDGLAGGVFGLFQGALLITAFILVAVAFFPGSHWLIESSLPRRFFGACHLSTHITPSELAAKVRSGLNEIEKDSQIWMHP